MAVPLVSAATGVLGPVLGKLAALLGDEYKRLRSIHSEIKSLAQELETIDAFLEDMAEAEVPSKKDKAWMKDVRELSYDVEDNLDEFMARVVADKSTKPDGFIDKIMISLKRVKARHEIAKAIEDLKKQAIKVSKRNKRYRSGEAGASNTSNSSKIDHRALVMFEDVSKLVCVDGPKKEVLQLLADCESTQQTKLVAIVGFGGLGKTTIANQVYEELKGQYIYCAFVSVSRSPDIVGVMSTIYRQLNDKYSPPLKEELQTIIGKIRDFLKQNKRYLIVVDDIWKVEEWDAIKGAFPGTSSGSKIITTTRINDVAESCRSSFSGHIYNLRPLNMMQSKQLLYTRLFGSVEKCPSKLKEVGELILEKCDGIPLAIIAISGVLHKDARKEDLWEGVKDSIGRALRKSKVDTMVNIISLSYIDLPPDLKTCLLYLSIFPEDHIIEKDNLIRRWIGEGFIHEEEDLHMQGGPTLYELGENCFNGLINRSLIQPEEIDRTFGHEVKTCRVHDTVHDFIVSKAVEENFITIIGVPGIVNPDPESNKVRRLSLQKDGEVPPGLLVSSARSLHVFGHNVKIPSLSKFRLLRVLDFDDCGQLEDDDLAGSGKLLHLKYLRFRHAHSVSKLPEELAKLQHLEIDINGYNVMMEIPEIIQQRLICNVTLVSDGWTTLPDEIANIQALGVLEGLGVYDQSTEFVEALGSLNNLRKLSITFYNCQANGDTWEENTKEVVSSTYKLGKASLESLHICIDEGANYIFEESWFPSPPCGLRELVIERDYITMVPAWMESLVSLEKLSLLMGGMEEEGVEILGALPSLRYLSVQWDKDSDGGPEMEVAMARAMEAHPNCPTLVWTYQ